MDEEGSSRAGQASHVTLPRLEPAPATVLDFLKARFPRIPDWEARMARGLVRLDSGEPLDAASPYRMGLRVAYRREVPFEARVPFEEAILFQDARILVADKPPFLPVAPAGAYVNETLLARLQARTGLRGLAPLHRLDRETAGLVLFSIEPASRGAYHALFAERRMEKAYEAWARVPSDLAQRDWLVETRIEPGEPFFRMRNAEGEPNARSRIELLERRGELGRFRVRPESGRKHQVRLHLLAIGCPILHDRLYPVLLPEAPPDFERPLQLLAKSLSFRDPFSGETRQFESEQCLASHGG